MPDFRIEFASNAAPFFSDHTHAYVRAETPLAALQEGIRKYEHQFGLFAAIALNGKGKMLARYLSSRAATSMDAPCGLIEWKGEELFCSGRLVPTKPERWEEFPEAAKEVHHAI